MLSEKIWRQAVLPLTASIEEAIESLNRTSLKIVLIANLDQSFMGTVSDGDIRRAMLRGKTLQSSVEQIANIECFKVMDNFDLNTLPLIMRSNQIFQIPIVNANDELVGLHVWDEFSDVLELENVFVVMAGGQGERLRPYTENCPKPLVPVAGRPILEHIIEHAKQEGFRNFIFSINYLGHMIRDRFGDGHQFGVSIEYIEEDEPMGTAGSLSLVTNLPKAPFIVSNGDVLTNFKYSQLLDFHKFHQADATMAVKLHEWQNPFGVVTTDGFEIKGFEEKPIYKSYVNAGIYVLNPDVLNVLEQGASCNMPDLFELLRYKSNRTIAYPMHEPWLDVGRPEDLHKTTDLFK
jgi:dTDP-glucose pyrophosphorylase